MFLLPALTCGSKYQHKEIEICWIYILQKL